MPICHIKAAMILPLSGICEFMNFPQQVGPGFLFWIYQWLNIDFISDLTQPTTPALRKQASAFHKAIIP
jgi:hypothetical protein